MYHDIESRHFDLQSRLGENGSARVSSKDERRVMIECRHLDGRTDTVVLGTVCDVRE